MTDTEIRLKIAVGAFVELREEIGDMSNDKIRANPDKMYSWLRFIEETLTRIQDEKQEPEPPEVKWLEKGFWICPRLCRGLLENLTAGHA